MTIPLNQAQRSAVEHPSGPLLILAGAGSGKTRVLTARIAALLQNGECLPERVLAVTFTNKAAAEMRSRVGALVGGEPRGLWIGTFHSLAARMLRREASRLGFSATFSIYDEDDQCQLIHRLLERFEYSPRQFPPRAVQRIVSYAKNRMDSPTDVANKATDSLTRVAAEIYASLGEALRAANAMDFDDLLLHPLRLFRDYPERLRVYQERFVHVLVDEFQDTNRAQYLFIRSIAEGHGNLAVVGDDDQAIYGWRGADVHNMLDFQRDFPDATVVRLEENYRSTHAILDAANLVIAGATERLGKTLRTLRQGGAPVTVCSAADERDEAEWIVRELQERVTRGEWEFQEIAILYRTNAQSRGFEEALQRSGLPYRVVGALGFYERREVKDLLAYLRQIANPRDDEAFLRAAKVPRRGIGDVTLTTLTTYAARWAKPLSEVASIADRLLELRPAAVNALKSFGALLNELRSAVEGQQPAAALEAVARAIGYEEHLRSLSGDYEERWENVEELIASAVDWAARAAEEVEREDKGSPLERFLAQAALLSPDDRRSGNDDGVTLMTLHTAKGLEWPVVVIAGLEDGLLPLARAETKPEGVDEERRLCYVGLTRARDKVYLTWARARRRSGQLQPSEPSRFLHDLRGTVEERQTGRWWSADRSRSRPGFGMFAPELESQDAPRYMKGERVRHNQFGSGTIVALEAGAGDLRVVVAFDDEEVGTKQLLAAYAGLERDWERG